MTTRKKKPFWTKLLSALLIACMLVGTVGTSSLAAAGDPGDVTEADAVSSDSSNGDEETTPAADTTNTDVTPSDKADPSAPKTNLPEGAGGNALLNASDTQTGTSGEGTGGAASGTTGTSDTDQEQNDSVAPGNGGTDEVDPEEKKEEVTPTYATVEEFLAAVAAVGEVDTPEDLLAAIDNCLSIYNKLSPEDKAAQAEAYEYIVGYREEVAAGNPDEGIEELAYTTYTSHITLYAGDGKPTGTKMKVGDHYNGNWYVEEISTSYVKFGSKYGEHNNNFLVPDPGVIWEGVRGKTYPMTKVTSCTCFSHDVNMNANGLIIYTAGNATYANVENIGSGGGDPTVPSGPYVTVVHKYYTNGEPDGSYSENKSVTGYYAYATNYYEATYNGNTYNSKSYDKYTIRIDGDGYQGTFNLTYNRTVATTNYTYKLVWDYNGGKVDNDSSRTKEVTTQNDSHTFYEDANGYGSPKPTRGGYTFKGWNYSGNGSFNSSNGQINMTGAANSTVSGRLTAIWEIDGPVDNGKGITVTKTRVSINDDASKTTAEPGDTISWNITVKNESNVTKTITLTEQLVGAYFISNNTGTVTITLEPEESETVTAEYTVKGKDKGTIVNTVKASTGKTGEDKEASDSGTPIAASYKVQWFDKEGKKIKSDETREGTVGTRVSVTDADKSIIGYNYLDGDSRNVDEAELKAGDSTVLKLYFEKRLWAKWVDEDGKLLHGPVYFDEGTTAPEEGEYTEKPTKAEDADYTYTFDYWAKTVDGDGNVTYTATYKATSKEKEDVDYYVFWLERVDDATTKQIKYEKRSGKLGATASVKEEDKSYPNYTFLDNDRENVESITLTKGTNSLQLHFAKVDETTTLTIEKTADKKEVKAGDSIQYTIKVKNTGSVEAKDVKVTDVLDTINLKFESWSLDGGEEKTEKPAADCYIIGNIGAGKTVTLVISAKVKDGVPTGTKIENTATAEYTNKPKDDPNPTSKVIVTVVSDYMPTTLEVKKEADKQKAAAGDEVVYTITVENKGANEAKNVIVRDKLPEELELISAKLEGKDAETQDADTYSIGNLAAGKSVKLVITAKVKEDVAIGTEIENVATAKYDNKPENEPDPEGKATVEVVAKEEADRKITIWYVDENGNILKEQVVTVDPKSGDKYKENVDYDVTTKVEDEFTDEEGNNYVKNGDPDVELTGTMGDEDILIKVPYALKDTEPENPTDPTDPTDPTPTPPGGGGGGGNNDDDDDDDDDPTPTPSTPQTPGPTPIIPGPVPTVGPTTTVVPNVTPVPATPAAPTPTAALVSPTPEAVELADEAVPLAAEEEKEQPEPVAVDEEETPLAGGKGAAWALINFALMNLAIFESVMLLIGYFVKTKNDEEEEKRKLKKKGIFRVISLPIAIISLIVFILTEDITLPTAFVDKYTIVMLIIAIVQTVMVALSNKKYEDEEEV